MSRAGTGTPRTGWSAPSKIKRKEKPAPPVGASEPYLTMEEITEAIRRYPLRERDCMSPYCDNVFTSTGPHHRMCDVCRSNV